jgi:hypothetical protein
MAESESKVELKAAGFNSTVDVTRDLVGAAVFDRFVDQLPPELADYIKRPRLATAWIPFADFIRISELMGNQLFGGDLERAFEVGRRQFKADLSTVYKVFVRLGSVSFIAKRCALIYGTYTRNAGTMKVLAEQDHQLDVEISGHPFARPSLWQYLRGTVHGAAEASGAKSVKTTIVEAQGQRCVIRLAWV